MTIPLNKLLAQQYFHGSLLCILALVSFCATQPSACCRPIRLDIPHNKLTGSDAVYLILKDHNKIWLHSLATKATDAHMIQQLYAGRAAADSIRRPLREGIPGRKEVALTFDDGPHGLITLQLLSILQQHHVPATFFVVGQQVEKYPAVTRALQNAGMVIGNHTYHHVSLTKIPAEYAIAEIKSCGEAVKTVTGHAPYLFRPPGGDFNPEVQEIANYLGYTMVLWTDDPSDFKRPAPALIFSRVLARLHPGGIILLHDGIPQMVAMLPQLLQYLHDNGYAIVPLEQMIKERAGPGTPLASTARPRARRAHSV